MANPWYAWYPGDYVMKTMGLSWAEDLAYRRLLDSYYGKGGAIPDGEQYEVTRAGTEPEKAAVDKVLKRYFELNGDGCWHQKRADRELEVRRKAFERQSEGARRANAKRWGGDRVGITKRSATDQVPISTGSGAGQLAVVPTPTPTPTPTTKPNTPSSGSYEPSDARPEVPKTLPAKLSSNGDRATMEFLFAGPVNFLVERGVKESQARSVIGKLVKNIGEGHTFDLVCRCMEVRPIEPVAWLMAGEKHYAAEIKRAEFQQQAFGSTGAIKPYEGEEGGA